MGKTTQKTVFPDNDTILHPVVKFEFRSFGEAGWLFCFIVYLPFNTELSQFDKSLYIPRSLYL